MSSPAFQFYTNEWIGNYNVQLLSLEEEGAYIRLLCYCWNEGSIPNDPEACARLIGKGASTTLATKLLPRFTKDANDPSRLVHARLEKEREKQRAWSEKSKLGGKKSGESRKKASEMKGGSCLVEPPYEPNGNSSSSSSHFSEREGAHIPSVEEIIEYGEMGAGIPRAYCEEFHAKTCETHGWIVNKQLIDWRRKISRFWGQDRANWPNRGRFAFNGVKTPLERQIADHVCNPDSKKYKHAYTPEEAQEYKRLKADLEKQNYGS